MTLLSYLERARATSIFSKKSSFPLRKKSTIEAWLRNKSISQYKIHNDLSVTVYWDVRLDGLDLHEFPFQFREVQGNFSCEHSSLTTLKGAPIVVVGDFNCSNNKLKNLLSGPEKVSGTYSCFNNQLTSLQGAPEEVYMFDCANNQLTDLIGSPRVITKTLNCFNNNIQSFEGAPLEVKRFFMCQKNRLTSLSDLTTIFQELVLDQPKNTALDHLANEYGEIKLTWAQVQVLKEKEKISKELMSPDSPEYVRKRPNKI